ncbi:MAG: hypothetical protein ACRBN8_01295 [Nannocystales bacterium]
MQVAAAKKVNPVSRKSNWIFLFSLGGLSACDEEAPAIPPCDPDRLGRACNDVEPLSVESGGSGGAASTETGPGGNDSNDSGTGDGWPGGGSSGSGSTGYPYGTTGYPYGTTGYPYGTTGYGYGSTGYFAGLDPEQVGLLGAEQSACLSDLDCGELLGERQ